MTHSGTLYSLSLFLFGLSEGYPLDPPHGSNWEKGYGVQVHPIWDREQQKDIETLITNSRYGAFYANRACERGAFDLRVIFTAEIQPGQLVGQQNWYEAGLTSDTLHGLRNLKIRVYDTAISRFNVRSPNFVLTGNNIEEMRAQIAHFFNMDPAQRLPSS